MSSDSGESRGYEHDQQQQPGHENQDRCSGEGAASALEQMRTQMKHRRLAGAGDSRGEAVLSDT